MRQGYLLLIVILGFATSGLSQLKKIKIGDAELSYSDNGSGVPVVFVHGGMEDYRTWTPQTDLFSIKYRVINYSRRFNYPNHNTNEVKDFSALTEANDLAQLISQLKLQPAHLVGHSFGGLVALSLAIHYPLLVKSLTLSEPPLISWLPSLPDGIPFYNDFYNNLWKPVKQDFEQKDTAAVMRHTLLYFYGADVSKEIPTEDWKQLISNLTEWHAIAYSTNAFPALAKEDVQHLKMPVMLFSAGNTMPVLRLTNAELKRLLPKARNFQLMEGTHDYWVTHPKQMGNVLMKFLQSLPEN